MNAETDECASATTSDSARRRAAIETYVQHEASLRSTARRFSICADDAEDALQRALEILLRKAPSDAPDELVRWTQTVVRHEALAVRRERERLLAGPAATASEPGAEYWVERIPAEVAGPPERAERREAIARSREALQGLRAHELRALTLLAEGYSYAEIGEITGFSRSKVNHSVARGRERFRRLVSRSEDGSRCEELGGRLSAFCDGEIETHEADTVREHLRACPHCRATLRAYRAAPAAAAALAPTLPLHRSLLDRAGEALTGLSARLGGGGSDAALTQMAGAGGTRGVGTVALAKALALCIGTVGGAAACVATGVVPAPLGIAGDPVTRNEPAAQRPIAEPEAPSVGYAPSPEPAPETPPAVVDPELTPAPSEPAAADGAVEYAPPPAPVPSAASGGGDAGNAAGEFGP